MNGTLHRALCGSVLVMSAFVAVPGSAAVPADAPRAVALAAADRLERQYVFPERGRRAAVVLRTGAESGAYDTLGGDALAARLTADVAAILHDKHVRVEYSDEVNPASSDSATVPSPEEAAAQARFDRRVGYGLGRVAHLPGNVGYVDLRFFTTPGAETDRVIDAMADSIAWSDAVVLDLRRNQGGDPETVARFLSHFLAPNTHLNDFVGRGDGDARVEQSTYTKRVSGARITARLYVLTSSRTFSGGEECAYDIRALNRGTLVGAVTGGGANPGETRRIDDHFSIFVPTQRARNPITKTNWEGTGVVPDVAVAADEALRVAYGSALDAALAGASARQNAELRALRAKVARLTDAEILAL